MGLVPLDSGASQLTVADPVVVAPEVAVAVTDRTAPGVPAVGVTALEATAVEFPKTFTAVTVRVCAAPFTSPEAVKVRRVAATVFVLTTVAPWRTTTV